MGAKLVDAENNQEYVLREDVNTMGRMLHNDIVLLNPAVSRFHAEIGCEDGAWYVEDQGSSYGTYVNEEKVEGAVALKDGDAIRIGVSRHVPNGAFNLTFRELGEGRGLASRIKKAAQKVIGRRRIEAGTVEFERRGAALIGRMSGVFRMREMDALVGRIRDAFTGDPLLVVLDLSSARYMNSYALSALIDLLADYQDKGMTLRVFGATGTVHKLMVLPGEANPIDVCETEEEALRAC